MSCLCYSEIIERKVKNLSLKITKLLTKILSSQLNELARSSNLPTAATMVGGTQLFEGAHLTGDNTHFFLESGRYSDYVFLTQMCPLKQ